MFKSNCQILHLKSAQFLIVKYSWIKIKMLFFLGKQLLSRVRETQVIPDVVTSGGHSEPSSC